MGALVLNDDEQSDLIERIEREGRERRDQTCFLFETDHAADVKSLSDVYEYLDALDATERRLSINRGLIATLPDREREAGADQAPDFCDEPGADAEARGEPSVGLPEPDPVIPKRPPSLDPPTG